jgi:ketosteroid isomerase-like protein
MRSTITGSPDAGDDDTRRAIVGIDPARGAAADRAVSGGSADSRSAHNIVPRRRVIPRCHLDGGLHMNPAEATVREFWRRMATNDFDAVAPLLAEAFVLEWPQSNERIRGAQNFARMNREYPAHGPWRFELRRLVAGGDEVVTQVAVTDGTQSAEAISFFQVRAGRIVRLVEFWPERYPAPANREHLVEPLQRHGDAQGSVRPGPGA